jgi:hypothetical protein
VLRRILGPKRDEVTGEWRRLHKKEFSVLYSSSNIRVTKSRRQRNRAHSTHERKKRVWWGNLSEGVHLKEPGLDGCIILK